MIRKLVLAGGALVGLAAAVVAVVAAAGILWSRESARIRAEIADGALKPGPADVEVAALPPPVARYLARAIPAGAGRIRVARLVQEGDFRAGEGEAGWRRFSATQLIRAHPPAFVWDARIAMAPLLDVRVRDSYRDGEGGMKARIAALVPVVDAAPTPELARAALHRYLAEAAWMPTRLLPGDGLTWTAVDDSTAVATLTDSGVTVSVRARFDAAGDLVEIHVADRGREVDGRYVPTPWTGRFRDWGVVAGGFRIPRQAEVAWIVAGDAVPYWRGRVTGAAYQTGG